MRGAAIVVLVCLCCPGVSAGQDLPPGARESLKQYAASRDAGDLDAATGLETVLAYSIALLQASAPRPSGLAGLRTDLQAGSSVAGGSTSILTRTSATDLLSAAFESGAVVRQADDKAMTLTVNALPIQQLLAGHAPKGCGAIDDACRSGVGRWLRGLSGSMTFSTSSATRAVTDPTAGDRLAFLTGGRAILGLTARYEWFVRERETAEQQIRLREAAEALSPSAADFLAAAAPVIRELDRVLPNWSAETEAALVAVANAHVDATPETVADVLEPVLIARLDAAVEIVRAAPAVSQPLLAVVEPARQAYVRAMNAVLAEKLYRKALTLDYANVRPSDQAAFHQLKLIWSVPLGGRPTEVIEAAAAVPGGTFTINGGVSWFNPGVDGMDSSRIRDTQVSLGFDWSPASWGSRRPVYTLAYYFQYMHENGVIQFNGDAITPGGATIALPGPAEVLLDTKGAIHVVQAGVSLPVGAGIRIPASVSYSNRSELITGRAFWQGHIGVSYDFSALKPRLGNRGPVSRLP